MQEMIERAPARRLGTLGERERHDPDLRWDQMLQDIVEPQITFDENPQNYRFNSRSLASEIPK